MPSPQQSVFELLRKRYEGPAWAFLEEVRNGTGYTRVTRTADAIAMGLWPSRGLHLHGFEVKAHRADWVRELRDPEKAEEIAQYCHYWWLVAANAKVVEAGEVPDKWGLLVSDGKKLNVVKEAAFSKAAKAPNHRFLAAILRKVVSTATDESRLIQAKKAGFDEGWRDGVAHGQEFSQEGRTTKMLEEQHKRLTENVQAFEKASGLNIAYARSEIGRMGEAVRLLTNEHTSTAALLERLADQSKRIAKQCSEAAAEARKAFQPSLTPPVDNDEVET